MGKHSKNNIISLSEARHAHDNHNDNVIDFNEAKDRIVIGKHSMPDAHVNSNTDADYVDDEPEFRPHLNDGFYKAIMSSIIVVMALILVFAGVRLYDTYVVEDIQVIGNDSFEYFEVIQYSGIEYRQSMLSVNKEDTIEKIESQKPMLQVESVEKTMPNTVVITVKERKPNAT